VEDGGSCRGPGGGASVPSSAPDGPSTTLPPQPSQPASTAAIVSHRKCFGSMRSMGTSWNEIRVCASHTAQRPVRTATASPRRGTLLSAVGTCRRQRALRADGPRSLTALRSAASIQRSCRVWCGDRAGAE
jgi:hypothetical protein